MKKILTASLVAMMAVSAANADIASTQYVGKSIQALDVAEVTAADGSYFNAYSETDGKVSMKQKTFDTTVTSTSKNAPTSGAVSSAITTAVGNLDVAKVTADAGKYFNAYSETDGKVSMEQKAFDTSVTDDSTSLNAPTTKAVSDFVAGKLKPLSEGASSVDGRVTALEGLINGDEENGVPSIPDLIDEKEDKGTAAGLIGGLDVSEVTAADGSYFNAYSETDGKVSMKQKTFDTTVTSTSKNAPTSGAVSSAITTAVGNLDVSEVTAADGSYFNAYSETDGKVSMKQKTFDTTVTSTSNNAPTSKAVHTAINAVGQTAGNAVQRSQVGMGVDFTVSEACKAKDVVCSLTIKGTGTTAVAQWEVVQY